MNKIQKMIKELCPNGVEWKKLGKILKYEQPAKYIVKSTDYLNSGIPVLTAGKTFILGYTNEDNYYKASKNSPVILFDDFTTSFKWIDFNFKVKSSAVKLLKLIDNDKYVFKYIYYAMQTINYSTLEHSRQWIEKYSQISIPVPPLALQEEIVKILDNFTALQAELESKLQAELTARKQQYEYYRNRLLSFDNILKRGGVIRNLGEVCEFIVGGDVPKNNYSKHKTNDYNIPIYSNGTDKNMLYGYTNQAKIDKPCVSISARGTIGYCKLHKQSFFPIVRLICAIPSESILKSDYLRYCLDCINIKGTSTGIPQLTVPMIKTFLIPIPPLEVQEELVEILDNFESMCNSLNEGIPAEISARKLQYEYYRDKLLSFDNNVY